MTSKETASEPVESLLEWTRNDLKTPCQLEAFRTKGDLELTAAVCGSERYLYRYEGLLTPVSGTASVLVLDWRNLLLEPRRACEMV
jgi:hypothetical protein